MNYEKINCIIFLGYKGMSLVVKPFKHQDETYRVISPFFLIA